jgi:DNA-binding PadR family transcriptional regulator
MSTRLVILGLLREQPLYGYEIKQIIEEHMEDWTSIAFGSIYFALGKLTEEGFLENVGVQQTGNRPSRNIYRITDSGRDEFLRLLRAAWSDFERQYFTLDVGIFFMNALSPKEIEGYLDKRIAVIEAVLSHIDQHQAEEMAIAEVPPFAEAIFQHSLVHMRAELQWTKFVLEKVRKGDYLPESV